MGQRAYREKYTESLVRDYHQNKGNVLEEQYFFSGKPKDIKFIYDLDDPLKDIDTNSVNINRGLINCIIPKNTKINNLKLIIKSNILGTKISYLHSNLYCLFGTHFIKDITTINISLYNPDTDRFVNERRLIKNILDFMCFKTIKLVNINNNLMYYVIPENSEFAIVLAYKEINYAEKHANFLLNLEDLIFHPYSKFIDSPLNYQRCLGAIEKTIPKEVTNLILPTIIMEFPSIDEIENNLNFEKKQEKEKIRFNNDEVNEDGKKNIEVNMNGNVIINEINEKKDDSGIVENTEYKVFQTLNNFLKEIKQRDYRVISFELKMKLDNLDAYNPKDKTITDKKQNEDLNKIINDENNDAAAEDNNNNFSYNKLLSDLNRDYHQVNSKSSNFPLHVSDNSSIHLTHNSTSNPTTAFGAAGTYKNSSCSSKKTPNKSFYNEDYAIQSYSEQYMKLVKIFLKENLGILKSFQQVFVTFDFNFNSKYKYENTCSRRNEYIAYYFKKLLIKFNLENVTLIHHINFTVRNEQTALDDQFDYLDYVFFKKEIADDLYKKLFLFKKSALLLKLNKRKSIMYKIFLEFLFDFSHCLFKEGRFDYSFQIMKNSKIVPMQLNSNRTIIFKNNN